MSPETKRQEALDSENFANFLTSHEPGLEIKHSWREYLSNMQVLSEGPSYYDILAGLRTVPQHRQEQLLVNFFTNEVNLPNGEEVGQFLAKVNSIAWFQPQEEPDQIILQKNSDEIFQRANLDPLPIRMVDNLMSAWVLYETHLGHKLWEKTLKLDDMARRSIPDKGAFSSIQTAAWAAAKLAEDCAIAIAQSIPWEFVMNEINTPAREALEVARKQKAYYEQNNNGYGPEYEKAKEAVRKAEFRCSLTHDGSYGYVFRWAGLNVGKHVADVAAKFAGWIVAKDYLPDETKSAGHPYEPLLEGILDKGYWFIGPVEGESVIFVPPTKRHTLD